MVAIGRDFNIDYNLKAFQRSEVIFWESIQVLTHKPDTGSKVWNILRFYFIFKYMINQYCKAPPLRHMAAMYP